MQNKIEGTTDLLKTHNLRSLYVRSQDAWLKYEYLEGNHPYTLEDITRQFDFTHHILQDPETFIKALAGSFNSPNDKTDHIWKDLAKLVFEESEMVTEMSNMWYDRSIMACSFQETNFKKVGYGE